MGMNAEYREARIMDYVRILRAKKKDPEKIHNALQKGLRIEHPEKIMGYAGFFYSSGDVYASGDVARWMNNDESFRSFVMDSLRRFDKGDYALISSSDRDENIENRWLFGIGRQFGRYGYHYADRRRSETDPFDEMIFIREHEGNTWITMDSELDWFLFLDEERMTRIKDRIPEEEE